MSNIGQPVSHIFFVDIVEIAKANGVLKIYLYKMLLALSHNDITRLIESLLFIIIYKFPFTLLD